MAANYMCMAIQHNEPYFLLAALMMQCLERYELQRPARRFKQQQRAADRLLFQATAGLAADVGRKSGATALCPTLLSMLSMTTLQHTTSSATDGHFISTEVQGAAECVPDNSSSCSSPHHCTASGAAAISGKQKMPGCSNLAQQTDNVLDATVGRLLAKSSGMNQQSAHDSGPVLQESNDLDTEKQAACKCLSGLQHGSTPAGCLNSLQVAGVNGHSQEDMRIFWSREMTAFNQIKCWHAHWPLLLCTAAFLAAFCWCGGGPGH
jgi:hypothetical protein